jgi:replication-associated recombination protein RarA
MANINSLLLWEKYRPKTLEDIILLPRIRKQFENGVNRNYIFHGHFGTGKTTLARILVGKYDKSKAFLELNSSLYTSIDVLRSDIEIFCKTTPMMDVDSDIKYVFLDEFERVSPQYQDAFKAFIEKYHKNVRFILTTNHYSKISPGIKSRFTEINFDCQNLEEEKYLKNSIFKRINDKILPSENKEISKETLISVVSKKFPDFRSIMVEIQNFIETGEVGIGTANVSNKIKLELYQILYDTSYDYEKTYHFLMNIFGPDKIDSMIKLLGKPFIDYCISESRSIDKLFECNYIIADYSSKLETNTDPIILGMTIIGKLRDILK